MTPFFDFNLSNIIYCHSIAVLILVWGPKQSLWYLNYIQLALLKKGKVWLFYKYIECIYCARKHVQHIINTMNECHNRKHINKWIKQLGPPVTQYQLGPPPRPSPKPYYTAPPTAWESGLRWQGLNQSDL